VNINRFLQEKIKKVSDRIDQLEKSFAKEEKENKKKINKK
jgi:hypothetical protein